MKKTFLLMLALLISTATIFSGCFFNNKNNNVIRLNEVTRSIFYAPLYIAIEEGFFEEVGLDVQLYTGEGADKSMTSLLSGGADIGLMGVEAAIYVNVEGKQDAPKVFGQLTRTDGSFLVGREDIEDFDWYTHLLNKEVVVGRKGGMPAMTFEYAINQLGLIDGENITLNFDIPFGNLGPAFVGGTGDFVNLFEPAASAVAQGNKDAYILGSVGQLAGDVPFTAFMATESYLNKNSDKVEKFLQAIVKGYEFLVNEDMDTVALSLRKTFKTTSLQDLINTIKSYKSINGWAASPVLSKDAFDRILAVMQNAGELEKDVKFEDIVDNTFAEKIMAD